MTGARAVVIGLSLSIVLVVGAIAGVRWAFDGSAGAVPPIWERPVWDGTQFVLNDSSTVGDPEHWTSADGIEWTREPGLVLGAGDFRCHPEFPCDVQPDVVEEVPMLYADPQTWIVAGRDDIALAVVTVRYDVMDENGPEPQPDQIAGLTGRLHPAILAMAARESECFDELRRLGPGYDTGQAGPVLVGYGGGHSGDQWLFNATCLMNGEEETFTVDLGARLDSGELQLLERGSDRELWVVRADGSRNRVSDPPLITYRDPVGDEPTIDVAPIAATANRFWASGDEGLEASADGFDWQPFEVDTDGLAITQMVASAGTDVALLLGEADDVLSRQPKHVMVSHDEGRTWSDIIPIEDGPVVYLSSVGPAGVAVSIEERRGEREVFIDDATGEAIFSARSPLGNNALSVGADTVLMPRERMAASGEIIGPVLDVYDTSGQLISTVSVD